MVCNLIAFAALLFKKYRAREVQQVSFCYWLINYQHKSGIGIDCCLTFLALLDLTNTTSASIVATATTVHIVINIKRQIPRNLRV